MKERTRAHKSVARRAGGSQWVDRVVRPNETLETGAILAAANRSQEEGRWHGFKPQRGPWPGPPKNNPCPEHSNAVAVDKPVPRCESSS